MKLGTEVPKITDDSLIFFQNFLKTEYITNLLLHKYASQNYSAQHHITRRLKEFQLNFIAVLPLINSCNYFLGTGGVILRLT